MADHPILFKSEMIRAILDGRKTQTRRIIKPQPTQYTCDVSKMRMWEWRKGKGRCAWAIDMQPRLCAKQFFMEHCPYGVPGDLLIPAMTIPSLSRNYCADVCGDIWSRARDGETWKRLRGAPTSKGYLCVTPAIDKKYMTRLVHRLICEAFYGPSPIGKDQVRHLDGNQLNNAPENLDWGSQHDNWSDRYSHGTGCGESHPSAKLMRGDIGRIKSLSNAGHSQRRLAKRFGVVQSTIWFVLQGHTWVDNPQPNPRNMPKAACRLWLKVKSVRVERVQEISREDAIAEGVDLDDHDITCMGDCADRKCDYVGDKTLCDIYHTDEDCPETEAFGMLWDSINAKPKPRFAKKEITHYESYPWEQVRETREYRGKPWHVYGNPHVFATEFERYEQ